MSSVGMAATVLAMQQIHYSRFLLPAYVLTGAAVYLAGIRLLKVLDGSDVELLRHTFGERTARCIEKILC